MRTVKIVLSVVALLVAAGQFALTNGLWNLPPGAIAVVGAVASFFFAIGIQPVTLTPRLSQIFGAIAGLVATVMGIHAANVSRGVNPHPWAWAIVGAAGILLGAMGRLQLPSPKPANPPPTV